MRDGGRGGGGEAPTSLTSLLISFSLSGAVREVALIIRDVWCSESFLIHLWPGTRLHTCTCIVYIQCTCTILYICTV